MIQIKSNSFSIQEIKKFLEDFEQPIQVELNNPEPSFEGFSLDPISLITAGGGIAVALITGLFAYINSKKSGEILIKTKNIEVKFPRNSTPKEIEAIKDLAKAFDNEITQVEILK